MRINFVVPFGDYSLYKQHHSKIRPFPGDRVQLPEFGVSSCVVSDMIPAMIYPNGDFIVIWLDPPNGSLCGEELGEYLTRHGWQHWT